MVEGIARKPEVMGLQSYEKMSSRLGAILTMKKITPGINLMQHRSLTVNGFHMSKNVSIETL